MVVDVVMGKPGAPHELRNTLDDPLFRGQKPEFGIVHQYFMMIVGFEAIVDHSINVILDAASVFLVEVAFQNKIPIHIERFELLL